MLAAGSVAPRMPATALFFTAPARLAATFEFEYVRILADGRAQMSAGFDGELFR